MPSTKSVCRVPNGIFHWSITRNTPVVNRTLCSPIRLGWDFLCSCLRRVVQDGCLRFPESTWRVPPRAHRPAAALGASTHRHPNPPHPTPRRGAARHGAPASSHRPPRRCAPPRPVPPVVCPGFGFDRCGIHAVLFFRIIFQGSCLPFVDSKTRTYRGRVGAGRRMAGQGGAGQDRTPRDGSPTSQPSLVPTVRHDSPQARTN